MTLVSFYQQTGTSDWKNKWILVCGIALIIGLYLSPALMSIGMISTALLLFTPGAWAQLRHNLSSQPLYWLLFGIFCCYLLSGLYSDNTQYWSQRVQIKLPYLLLPLSFATLKLEKHILYKILYFLFVTVLIGAIGSLINFALHYEVIVESYLHAKTMPTPFEVGHIRFSLLSAFCALIGWTLYQEKFYLQWKQERWLMIGGAFFLVVFLHILSVRSGLLAFYTGAIVWLIAEALKNKSIKHLLLGILLLSVVSGSMYFLSPTLRNKATYMNQDVSRFKDGKNVNNYSDGNRLLSWKLGWRIGNEQPLIGVGIGDVLDKITDIYVKEYPLITENNRLIPHSQFIYIFAGCGWIGLLWFVATCFYSYSDSRLRAFPLLMVFNTIIVTSFISESTLEIQVGVALHVFFLLLLLSTTNKTEASGKLGKEVTS